jgi:NADH-quinone oxidoreductase subunit M
MSSLLVLLIVAPLVAAAVVLLLGNGRTALVRQVSLITALGCGAIVWEISTELDRPTNRQARVAATSAVVKPAFETTYTWLSFSTVGEAREGGLQFRLGVDGVSLCVLALTAILTVVAVLVSWTTISDRVAQFHALLLVLASALFGAFSSFDLICFYVFFEITLIPLFFIVGSWGGPKRETAARKFLFYTLAGGLIMLVGLVGLAASLHKRTGEPLTFGIPELAAQMQQQMQIAESNAPQPAGAPSSIEVKQYWYDVQWWVFLAIFVGFAIKTPLIPFHTWLPITYAEAPTSGTLMLAGVLSKLGCYGFLRICAPLLPYACWNIGVPLVAGLAAGGILYGALCALVQTDLKRFIAYSSVSHLGFIVLGVFALNVEGLAGASLQMLNHGLITASLFVLVGILAQRYETREIARFGGLSARLPTFTFLMFFFCMASVGLPGLNGFVGEFLCLIGMFDRHPLTAVIAALGVILGAWYLTSLLQRLFFGPLVEPQSLAQRPRRDVQLMEWAALAPCAVLCLFLGLYPAAVLDRIKEDVAGVAALYDHPERLQPPSARATQIAEAD